jgi:hypothetical protein
MEDILLRERWGENNMENAIFGETNIGYFISNA